MAHRARARRHRDSARRALRQRHRCGRARVHGLHHDGVHRQPGAHALAGSAGSTRNRARASACRFPMRHPSSSGSSWNSWRGRSAPPRNTRRACVSSTRSATSPPRGSSAARSGVRDLDYRGNMANPGWAGCPPEVLDPYRSDGLMRRSAPLSAALLAGHCAGPVRGLRRRRERWRRRLGRCEPTPVSPCRPPFPPSAVPRRSTAACWCSSPPTPPASRASRSTTIPARSSVFGVDVDGWQPGTHGTVDASAFGYPLESLRVAAARPLPRAGDAQPLRDVHAQRRPHREAPARPRRRAAVDAEARQPLQRAAVDHARRRAAPCRSCSTRRSRPSSFARRRRSTSSTCTSAANASRSSGARDMFLGAWVLLPEGFDEHPDARYPLVINHGHFPASFVGWRETPPDPNLKPDYSARASPSPATTASSRSSRTSSTRTGRGTGFPRMLAHRDPAPHALLRRLVRRELGEQRPVRRRDHVRARPGDRAALPRTRRRVGALHLRRLHRRLGGDGGADVLSRRLQRRLDRLSRPDRLPRLHRGRHLRGQERVLRGGPVQARAASRAAQLPRPRLHHARSRRTSASSRSARTAAVRRPVGCLGVRLLAARRGRLSRSRSGTSAPA